MKIDLKFLFLKTKKIVHLSINHLRLGCNDLYPSFYSSYFSKKKFYDFPGFFLEDFNKVQSRDHESIILILFYFTNVLLFNLEIIPISKLKNRDGSLYYKNFPDMETYYTVYFINSLGIVEKICIFRYFLTVIKINRFI